jgi:hypothetical protein
MAASLLPEVDNVVDHWTIACLCLAHLSRTTSATGLLVAGAQGRRPAPKPLKNHLYSTRSLGLSAIGEHREAVLAGITLSADGFSLEGATT